MSSPERLPEEVADVVARASPAAVHLWGLRDVEGRRAGGSGVVLSVDGLTLTSAEAARAAVLLEAELGAGESLPADLLGIDDLLGLALLRLRREPQPAGEGFPFVRLADSNALAVGTTLVAVGAPTGAARAAAAGRVVALDRTVDRPDGPPLEGLLEIEPILGAVGVGAPLFDLEGALAGVVIGGVPLAAAAPANAAAFVTGELLAHGRVRRASLGIVVEGVGEGGERAVVVRAVDPDGPAATAGVVAGDVITTLRGRAVHSVADLQELLDADAIRKRAELELRRDGRLVRVPVRPRELRGAEGR